MLGATRVAGWSSLVARRAHNPKVAGSNPAPAIENARPLHLQRAGVFVFALGRAVSAEVEHQPIGKGAVQSHASLAAGGALKTR